jgi:diacylglycerol kinase (ATP)
MGPATAVAKEFWMRESAMASASEIRASRLFVILNPLAGRYSARVVNEALGRHLNCADGLCDVHEATGRDDLTDLARAAAERGWEIVVAGGGDGTVSAVANGLIGTSAALAILPLGTGNVVAQELGIPVDLDGACSLLSGPHAFARIDAMEIRGRHYYMRVGIGLDALVIHETRREAKKRFGRVAYYWSAFTRLIGFQPRQFRIVVDGRTSQPRASEVALANCGTMARKPWRWGPGIRPDDGRIDVCIIRARNLIDFLILAWHLVLGLPRSNRHVSFLVANRNIAIASDTPLLVQGDGEMIGETPVEVKVVPGGMRVVVSEEGIPPPPV